MKRIDINVDVGEGFGFDEELLRTATSANVCCGTHAGSIELCKRTVELCRRLGVRVGAHPGTADRASMGRRPIGSLRAEERDELTESLRSQLSVAEWDYVKPHGALYNASTARGDTTLPLVRCLHETQLPLMGMPATHHEHLAFAAGVAFVREGFADRAYAKDGTLLPRSEPGAVLDDLTEIATQVVVLAERVDSICVHGDSPGCVEIAVHVRRTLEAAGYEVGA